MESNNPPFQNFYKNLFENYLAKEKEEVKQKETSLIIQNLLLLENDEEHQQQLPLIDLSRLNSCDLESVEECKKEIIEASKEWGFFQVVNHGISNKMLEKMLDEQVKAFRKPFDVKSNESDSYRWGTPTTAKSMNQFSWSEAFHIPLVHISNPHDHHHFNTLRLTIDEFATTVSSLAKKIAEILGENLLGYKSSFFEENCSSETSYLRLNRYPPCPISTSGVSGVDVFGLMPHTDSDFLTILYQDEVGGLQLVKDGRWLTVKPNPQALIINIGDLFQAWSNGVYKSVEHRVLVNKQAERFSTAYFLCPSYDSVIQSCGKTPMYREFSFREFRRQVQEDVKTMGYKVGLPRFLI